MSNLILFYVLIALIWWLFAFAYKNYMVDCTRQRLFKIRDELFDCAANYEISFNDEAYITTRTMLNGVIRFTHDISLIRFFIMNVVVGKANKEYSEKFVEKLNLSINKLNSKQQQDIIKSAIIKMHFAVVLHLLNTSLVLFPVFLLISAIMKFSAALKFKERFYNSSFGRSTLWDSVDAQANLIGRV